MGGSEAIQKSLSMAGIRAAARYTQGILRIPSRLDSAISAFLEEFSTRDLKQSAIRLSQAARKARLDAATADDYDDLPFRKDIPPPLPKRTPLKWHNKRHFQGEQFSKYKERDTAAYVAARMPAIYSAIHRVLHEVSRRLPDFKPLRIMDYGSGPGTAMWALCEVWPSVINHAHLVEPSQAMSHARRSLIQDLKDMLPEVRNFVSLEAFVRSLRPNERWHDLVIASYALGEIKSAEERISTARQLWSLTRDILIILEPGTPQGSNIVREIRSHILALERKKYWRRIRKDGKDVGDQLEDVGAFVVAPCAHDGICPMDGTGKFCHFSQRLEQSASQRLCKKPKGKTLRGYEDEKFSYVVLRRGLRPSMDWPLDRVDLHDLEAEEQKRSFSGVVIYEDSDEEWEDEEGAKAAVTVDEMNEDGELGVVENDHDMVGDGEMGGRGSGEEDSDDASSSDGMEGEDTEKTGDEGDLADFGSGWARVVFAPIKRSKQIMLDLCAAAEKDGSRGMLDRIVVKSSEYKTLHFQARRSRWGDLWPCGNIRKAS